VTTWDGIALPALHWLSEHEGGGPVNVGEIADNLGVDPNVLVNELDGLASADYLEGEVIKTLTGGDPRP
jgi:DNA-binding IscR family transcriptional regulator